MTPEKFSMTEVAALRSELLSSGVDSWDAARLLQIFLAGRGYGVSPEAALDAATKMEGAGCALEVMHKELEGLALVM